MPRKFRDAEPVFPFAPTFLQRFECDSLHPRFNATPVDLAIVLFVLGTFNRFVQGGVASGSAGELLDAIIHDPSGVMGVDVDRRDILSITRIGTEKRLAQSLGRASWTSVGGDRVFTEVQRAPGEKNLLTFHVRNAALHEANVVSDHSVKLQSVMPVKFDTGVIAKFGCRHSVPIYLRALSWIHSPFRAGLHECDAVRTQHNGIRVTVPVDRMPDVLGSPGLAKRRIGELNRVLDDIEKDFRWTRYGIRFSPVVNPSRRDKVSAYRIVVTPLTVDQLDHAVDDHELGMDGDGYAKTQ